MLEHDERALTLFFVSSLIGASGANTDRVEKGPELNKYVGAYSVEHDGQWMNSVAEQWHTRPQGKTLYSTPIWEGPEHMPSLPHPYSSAPGDNYNSVMQAIW